MGFVSIALPYDDRWFFSEVLRGAARQVEAAGRAYRSAAKISIPPAAVNTTLLLGSDGSLEITGTETGRVVDTDQLTNKGASEIPLNKRDFSQILLLAAAASVWGMPVSRT